MQEFMQAVAETLRNLGFSDAESGPDYVRVRGCEFYAHSNNRTFIFVGRSYKTGNTISAVLDLIQELPQHLARRKEELERRANSAAARILTSKLDDPCMSVIYYKGKFIFTYTCTDLADVSAKAERIAKEVREASEAAWQEILASPRTTSVKFTAEGGFSLN